MAFNFVPTGTVLSFAGSSAPTGWLICDGSAISRTTYSALFSAIGTVWGYGDNSTTFHLPDLRGRFLRGQANGSTNDPDRAVRTACNTGGATGDAVGSVQGHENAGHNHGQYGGRTNADPWIYQDSWIPASTVSWGPLMQHGSGGNEARPKNANVNYIIKV